MTSHQTAPPPQSQQPPPIRAPTSAATTHVLLRVKRRRPPPADAAAASRPSLGAANDDGGASATCPDRIEIALPRAPADGVGASAAKRRRIREKEDLALVRRLDAAVCLSDDRGPPRNDGDGWMIGGGEDAAPPRTPPRPRGGDDARDRSPSLGDVANDGDATGGDDAPRTPPSSAKMTSSADGGLEQPAPPAKPRRTAIFRRIASVQKRLSPPGYPAVVGGSDASWSPKGEERSKWLHVVDVALRDEGRADSESGEERGVDAASATGNIIVTGGGLDAVGCGGRRVPRMRPRPPTEVDDGGGGGRRKRQKLGWVVERSRTVLESEFWDKGLLDANTGIGHNGSHTRNNNNNNNDLDPETLRLIDSSLSVLRLQGGGSVAPHLSFLREDPRLGYVAGTPRGRAMVNHALSGDNSLAAALASDAGTGAGTGAGKGGWKGRTVLHVAALWGDLEGVRAALGMGADPTALDAGGDKPAGLVRRGEGERDRASVYDEVALALAEGEERAAAERNIQRDGNEGGEEYYYEVYCLETPGAVGGGVGKKGANPNGSSEEKKDDATANPLSSRSGSQFLRRPRGASAASIPDLELSSALPEEDDAGKDGGERRGSCALIELQKGFGYWNNRGELVLEAAPPDGVGQHGSGMTAEEEDERFVQRFYQDGDLSMGDDDEHDSNDEAYDGNDYPDEDASFGLGSDYDDYRDADDYRRRSLYDHDNDSEDEEGDWKMDFRSRFVTKDELDSRYGCFSLDKCDDGSDDV